MVERELLLLQPDVRVDTVRVRAFLHPEFLEHGASGRVWDRASIVDGMAGPPAEATRVRARRTGPDAALVTYVSRAGTRRALRSSTWVRDAGAWLLLFHQGTPTPLLEPAEQPDLPELLRLRAEAEEWLEQRGIVQWGRGEVSPTRVQAQLDAGEWHVVRAGGHLAAALRVLDRDPAVWDDDAPGTYVHGLVVDRRDAGQGLGRAVLDEVQGDGTLRGGPLRLDCVASNAGLRRWYADQGFREVGRRELAVDLHPVVLLQRP